jgi:hypothetical protein
MTKPEHRSRCPEDDGLCVLVDGVAIGRPRRGRCQPVRDDVCVTGSVPRQHRSRCPFGRRPLRFGDTSLPDAGTQAHRKAPWQMRGIGTIQGFSGEISGVESLSTAPIPQMP